MDDTDSAFFDLRRELAVIQSDLFRTQRVDVHPKHTVLLRLMSNQEVGTLRRLY